MKSGIYIIENMKNGKKYIGSSCDISKRWNVHKSELNRGTHHNEYLQNAWKKYEESAFDFRILEEVEPDKEKLLKAEQRWIDSTNVTSREYGYNLCPQAHSTLGLKHRPDAKTKNRETSWNKGIPTPESVKQKISETLKGRPSPMRGRIHTQESKQKMSESRSGEKNSRSVMTAEIVREIRKRYEEGTRSIGVAHPDSQTALAREYGVSKGCIKAIVKYRTWKNI